MAVKMIVFDIAGTTVKDTGAIAFAFQKAMQDFGYNVPVEEINPLMGYKKPQAIRMMLERMSTAAVSEQMIANIHDHFLQEMITHYETTTELEPLPGAEETFRKLHALGIKIVLDTGFSHDITAVIMQRLQWLEQGLVDMTVSSDEVAAGRPAPLMIQKAMAAMDIQDPKEVIKIGDTEVDVNEGKNANCLLSIAVTSGAFTKEALLPYAPDYILDNVSEILPLIEKL